MKRLTCIGALAALCLSTLVTATDTRGAGPDVLYSGIGDTQNHGNVGGIRAYSLGTNTCNIGDQNLLWLDQGTPAVGFNAYRLHDGRLIQLGLGFAKTACCAAAGNGCALACNGQGGNVLGAGCLDVYSAGWNSIQSALAPRSAINAYSGAFSGFPGTSGNSIFRRLQVAESDLNTTNFPGATYFVEGVYVGSDDAASNNRNNNASYRPVNVTQGTFNLGLISTTFAGTPAIDAWRAHGNGLNTPDTSVVVGPLDIPDEGRFHYAYKVTDNLDGTWRYEYAVFNLSSDRSGGSFSIPIPAGTTITNVGFHSPDYHSGEPYSNADWVMTVGSTSVTWTTPEPVTINPNSSALRWGTMYNFWFTADREPTDGLATLGLFKPHTPQEVTFAACVPGGPCIGDVNCHGAVDVDDLVALILQWGPVDKQRDCDGDIDDSGMVDVDDLVLLLLNWGGCPPPCR